MLMFVTACAPVTYGARYPSPRYFGYYGSAYQGEDDHIPQFADHVNLVHIIIQDFNDTLTLMQKLDECRFYNLKAMVTVEGIFFDATLNYKQDANITWSAITPILQQYIDVIVAFYVVDEPEGRANIYHITNETIMSEVYNAAKMVKNSFPKIATVYIEDSASIARGYFRIPNDIDWIGVDCYGVFSACNSSYDLSLSDYYAIISSQMSPDQRFILIPPVLTGLNALTEAQLIEINIQYLQYAKNNSRVVAILPFLWQNESTWVGANALPDLLLNLKQISNNFRSL